MLCSETFHVDAELLSVGNTVFGRYLAVPGDCHVQFFSRAPDFYVERLFRACMDSAQFHPVPSVRQLGP